MEQHFDVEGNQISGDTKIKDMDQGMVKKKRTFLSIEQDLQELHNLLVERVSAGDPIKETELELLDQYTQEAVAKRDSLAWFLTMKRAEEEAIRVKVAELQLQLEQREKARERMEDYFLHRLLSLNLTKVIGNVYEIVVKRNPPSLKIDEPDKIPDKFMVHPPPPAPYPDKAAIKRAIKAGEPIEGCEMITDRYRLEVK